MKQVYPEADDEPISARFRSPNFGLTETGASVGSILHHSSRLPCRCVGRVRNQSGGSHVWCNRIAPLVQGLPDAPSTDLFGSWAWTCKQLRQIMSLVYCG